MWPTAVVSLWRKVVMLGMTGDDAELMAMIERHDYLWALWTPWRAESSGGDDIMRECGDLERKILATPVFTAAGLAGKKRVIERAALDDDDGNVAAVLKADAERAR